jgi:hypothetical protein
MLPRNSSKPSTAQLDVLQEMRTRHLANADARLLYLKTAIAAHNSDACLIWPFGKMSGGYGRCYFGAGQRVRAHRLAFYLTHGRWPDPLARHTCDTPACFNPRHVIEGTDAQNAADRNKRNRTKRGEDLPQSKLTEDQVREIRTDCKARIGTEYRRLADKYDVSPSLIGLIVRRDIWKHVP